MSAAWLSSGSLVCSLGHGLERVYQGMAADRPGLRPNDLDWIELDTHIGRVEGIEETRITGALSDYDCRNNRLALIGLETDGFAGTVEGAAKRYGADRIAVVAGTSTSGIRETEIAYRDRDPASGALPPSFHMRATHEYFSLADFIQRRLGLSGPAMVVSTACSSSSKALVDAIQLIDTGLCDAAVVGGVDTLCRLTLRGFASLELLDTGPCRPWDRERHGISIGEAAGFVLVERASRANGAQPLAEVLGWGESSDAYHMSTPDPEGVGARLAMQAALHRAALRPNDIGYLNLHGTGTRLNDQVEDLAVAALFADGVACSSTKGWTGHPLGAAGIVGILIGVIALRHGFLPGNRNLEAADPTFKSRIQRDSTSVAVDTVMANAFGFGGSNCSVVLGRIG